MHIFRKNLFLIEIDFTIPFAIHGLFSIFFLGLDIFCRVAQNSTSFWILLRSILVELLTLFCSMQSSFSQLTFVSCLFIN